MQVVTIAGAIGRDAEYKTTQGGSEFCSFSVAVSTGYGDRKTTTWWDVTRWGKGADKLAPMLTKGTKVTVSGEVSTREHDGRTYLQVRADHLTLQGERRDNGSRGNGGPSQRRTSHETAWGGQDDDPLNDDVPFLSDNMGLERRAR